MSSLWKQINLNLLLLILKGKLKQLNGISSVPFSKEFISYNLNKYSQDRTEDKKAQV